MYRVEQFLETVVMGTLVTPEEYLGKLLNLCQVGGCIYSSCWYTLYAS